MIGRTLTALPAGPLWRWQPHRTLDVLIPRGVLSAVGDPGALAGEVLLAVEGEGGAVEVLAFATAILIAPDTWRLGRLLRGLGGSEAAASIAKPAGAGCVVLDGALLPVATGAAALGRTLDLRIAPAGTDHADPATVSVSVTPGPAALKPLAPVHATARREAGGVRIGWIRRARHGGDSWDLAEVPLAEEAEAYRLEIMAGSTVKRAVTVDQAGWLYPAADELADFGAAQTALALRVSQISRAAGAGDVLSAAVAVRG
jgi:hypothetical protein